MTDLENVVGTEGEAPQEQEPTLEDRMKLLEERQAELDKRERELNKGFMEVAARERELAERPVYTEEQEEEDDLPALAPEAEKVLDKYIQRKMGPVLQAQQELYAETVNSELEAVSQRTGLSPEDIIGAINDTGLAPKDDSIRSVREVMSAAAEIAKARKFNQEEFEKSIREKILKELAESGASIESVKPTRELPQEFVDMNSMTPQEKYEFLKNRQA